MLSAGSIADSHLCIDGTTSWHYNIINTASDLDPKFYEMMSVGPLLISVTISDSVGASKLFDKALKTFPNDWKILFQASYQAQIEEKNLKKAAELLYRAGKNGAPTWVFSLAGGLYNELGMTNLTKDIYSYLIEKFPEDETIRNRLKEKIDNKLKNYYSK